MLLRPALGVGFAIAAAAVFLTASEAAWAWPARVLGWVALMAVPGLALYRAFERTRTDMIEAAMAATLVSPVLLAVVATLAGLSGVDIVCASQGFSVAAGLCAGVLYARSRIPCERPPARQLLALFALLSALIVLTAFLPLTREWWRVRSDAWFHAAVVAQMRDYGLPPDDPYFLGLALQYMWFYHALVLALADTLHVDAFRVMALINLQALAGLTFAAYRLAAVFRERFVHRFTATASLLLAFNAAFWVFLPVKLVKAVMGDVRGTEEIMRTFALTPRTYSTALGFMNIYYNQEFFLDKYMVATAFGLALAFMTAGWAAACEFLATGRRVALAVLFVVLVGMLGFHSLVGFVMLVGIFGAVMLAHLFRGRISGYRTRDAALLLAVSGAAFLVTIPYLYQVMHLKESEQVFPLSLSIKKTVGIFIACAFVLFFAWRERGMLRDTSLAARFFVLATTAVTAFCLSITLPGPNTYDKLGYLVFIPLSIVGGFGLADTILSRRGRARLRVAALWTAAFLVPVNALAFAYCFLTPDDIVVTPPEVRLSDWARDHTDRDAVFLDDQDRVFLLVTGPRRYFCGVWAYAQQWGYPKAEMARRLHAQRALYTDAPLDASVLETLAGVAPPAYVIVRPEHRAAGAAVTQHPELFETVYDDGILAVVRVDSSACRTAASTAPAAPSTEEMIRESGL